MAKKQDTEMPEIKFRKVNIVDESKKDFVVYSNEVNLHRAFAYELPGIKPIIGHALWAMWVNGRRSNKSYTKSAKVEGEVMSFSPHGGCLTADTKMFLLSGEIKTLGELVAAGKDEYVLSIDANGNIIPALATEFRKTKDVNELYEIVFANGFSIKATGNHKFRLITGDWVAAEDLHAGHILDYGKFKDINDDYLVIHGNKTKSITLHRLVDNYFTSDVLPKGFNVHHIDENSRNNVPSNLIRLSLGDHMKYHNIGQSTRFGGEKSNWNRESNFAKNSALMSAYNDMQGLYKAKHIIDLIIEAGEIPSEEMYEQFRQTITAKGANVTLAAIYANEKYGINNFDDLMYLYDNDLISINYESNTTNTELGSNYAFVNKSDEHKAKCTASLLISGKVNSLKSTAIRHNFDFEYLSNCKCFEVAANIPTIVEIRKIECETTPVYDFTVNGPENALISISDDNSLLACAHNSYGALARMAADFIYHIPFIDGHGSFGSAIGGPTPGAPRYTEMRLSEFIEDVLFYNTKLLDMGLNYLEEDPEPILGKWVAKLPLLFMTNTSGMGYTISNTWTSGNLKEFAIELHNFANKLPINYEHFLADFPCGGVIANKTEAIDVYKNGVGTIKLRGKTEIEGDTIKVLSLPYQVYPEDFIEDVKKYVNGNANTIKDLSNRCGNKGFLIEIDCEEGTAPYTLECLFKKTCLQISISDEHKAIDASGKPVLITIDKYMHDFLEGNIDVVIKEAKLNLSDIAKRLEIVEGLLSALDIIDDIIKAIKASKSMDDAKNTLMTTKIKNVTFTEAQADAIVHTPLGRLANLEQVKLQNEKKELEKKQKENEKLVNSRKEQEKKFFAEFDALVEKYGWDRKTEAIDAVQTEITNTKIAKPEQLKVKKEFMIVLTSDNCLKRIDVMKFRKTDEDEKNIKVQGNDRFVMVSNKGNMYKAWPNNVDKCLPTASGTPISSIRPEIGDEKIIAIYTEELPIPYVYFMTKNGLGKMCEVKSSLLISKTVGATVCGFKSADDEVIAVKLLNEGDKIEITTSTGRKEVVIPDKPQGRGSAGKKVIGLKNGETITEVHSIQ